jgi:membrane-associated phospholipid phosphatase
VKRWIVAAMLAASSSARADEPAYQLKLDADLAAMSVAALSTTAWFLDLSPAACAPLCDRTKINWLDRPFAGRYAPGWTTAGTIVSAAVLVAQPMSLLPFETPAHAANDTVVLAQSVLFSNALSVIFEVGARRPRPWLYGTAAPLSERMDANSSFSFWSGHTAASFAATFASWRTLGRLGVPTRARYVVFGLSLAASTFVAMSRVASGDHFPTDVMVGAGVGTSFGFLAPALHGRGVAVVPSVTADASSVSMVGTW